MIVIIIIDFVRNIFNLKHLCISIIIVFVITVIAIISIDIDISIDITFCQYITLSVCISRS